MGGLPAQWKQGGKVGSHGNGPERNGGGRDWKGAVEMLRGVCACSVTSVVSDSLRPHGL